MPYTTTRQITRSTPPSHRPHLQSPLPTSLPPSQPRTITIVIISPLPTATPPRLPSPHHRTINTKATPPSRARVACRTKIGAFGLGCLDTKEGALVGVMVCTSMVRLVLVLTPLRVRLDLGITRQKGAFGSAYKHQQGAFGFGFKHQQGAFGLGYNSDRGVWFWQKRNKGAFGIAEMP
ncbi:hypothetical protein Tco_1435784 [Tanacetum coccineum]